ncbi:MAG: hypothetical protein JJP05_09200 [cyanobacterium endosymbiont of Rhopalodia gibba]
MRGLETEDLLLSTAGNNTLNGGDGADLFLGKKH